MIKKTLSIIMLTLLILGLLCSCNNNSDTVFHPDPESTINKNTIESPSAINKESSKNQEWVDAFMAFLNDLYENKKSKDYFQFLLKDLDNNNWVVPGNG